MDEPCARVVAVCKTSTHGFSKACCEAIEITAGLGVNGDAHAGRTVQHLSRVKVNPQAANLRQVHLIQAELFDEMELHGFALKPGDLGENITTRGVDLLHLGRGAILYLGDGAAVKVTGLRNPCHQIDRFAPGLLGQLALKTPQGIIRKAGIMAIAMTSGVVASGDSIRVVPASGPHIALERV